MATFTHHDDDGKIHQSTTVYSPDGYDKKLRDAGQTQFVITPDNQARHHMHWMVKGGEVVERKTMNVKVSKTRIKAGGTDYALISGVIRGTRLTVTTGGLQLYNQVINEKEIEIAIPCPCIYEVTLEKWPYKTFSVRIEAAQ